MADTVSLKIETQETSLVSALDTSITVLSSVEQGLRGRDGKDGKDGGAGVTGLFILDITTPSGIVGSKVFTPDTVPANATIDSCVTDSTTVRVTVGANGGALKYSPTITVNGLPVALTESATKRWFVGTVDVPVGIGSTVIKATSGGVEATALVTLAGAGPSVSAVAFGSYPNTQTALKLGDNLPVTITAALDAVSVTITGPASTLTLPVTAGVATGTLSISGATGTQTFSVSAKNSLGTAGAAFTSPTIALDQTYPTFSAVVVTYPNGQQALGVGDTAAINCTISGADAVAYTGTGLTITAPSTYNATKTVGHTLTGYTSPAYLITALRSNNGAVASTAKNVLVATVAPTASISINPIGRLVSSPLGMDYTVRITPSQLLGAAPTLNASAGQWQGAWVPAGNYWTRNLRIADSTTRGPAIFSGMGLIGPSGIAGSFITSGSTYTVGGFTSRTLTFAAFSRVAAIGATVGQASLLSAQIVGGNILNLQGSNAVTTNGFYPASVDGSYNSTGAYIGLSDTAFAGANTSGTLQIIVAEAA